MKKIILTLLICLMPVVVVNAEVTASTPSIGADAASDPTIEAQVDEEIKKNTTIKNVVKGYYIEGVSITCRDGKNTISYKNPKLSTGLTCANGNSNPYYRELSSGVSSFENGSACSVASTTPYAFATRVLEYDCGYVLGTSNEKIEYTPVTSATPENTTNSSGSAESKPTGTTENKDTGVEDYFLTLGALGMVVIGFLYLVDKKNIFKKI